MDGENSISFRLREIRKHFGMTQSEFARRLGGTQQSICQLERSARFVRPQVISSVCANFNINEHWLRTGEGEMFKQTETETDLARQIQRTLCQRIFASLPPDVQDAVIAICRDESAKRARQTVEAIKAKEREEELEEEEEFQDQEEEEQSNNQKKK